MTSLATLQGRLARFVQGGTPSEIAPAVSERAPGVEARLGVYRQLVDEVHLDALDQVYPVARAILGPDYWRALLRAVWDGPGSRDADLGRYGDFVPAALGEGLAQRPELEGYGYLPELAALEWEVHTAIERTTPERFDAAAFAALPEDAQVVARLRPNPVLRKLRLRDPVDVLWRRHRGESDAAEPAEEGDPALCCLHPVGRFEVGVSRCPTEDEGLLDQLMGGASLAELTGLGAGDGVARLQRWIQDGWIIGFQA